MDYKQKKILKIKCFGVFICLFIAFSVGFEYIAFLEAAGIALGIFFAGLANKRGRSFYEAQFIYGWRLFVPFILIASIRIFIQIVIGDMIFKPNFLIILTKLDNWDKIQSAMIPICSLGALIFLGIPMKAD